MRGSGETLLEDDLMWAARGTVRTSAIAADLARRQEARVRPVVLKALRGAGRD